MQGTSVKYNFWKICRGEPDIFTFNGIIIEQVEPDLFLVEIYWYGNEPIKQILHKDFLEFNIV